MIEYMRANALLLSKKRRMEERGEEIPAEKFTVGEFVNRNKPAMGVPDK
jgi:hypothetical protein